MTLLTRVQQQLLGQVEKTAASDCWEWRGQISNSGYGRLKIRNAAGEMCMQSAQHASYEAFIGPLPDGMWVTQTCSNRLCINPEHLELSDPVLR